MLYAQALDKGWHVGAVGAEDLGHSAPTTGAVPAGPRPWSCRGALRRGDQERDARAALLRGPHAGRAPDATRSTGADGLAHLSHRGRRAERAATRQRPDGQARAGHELRPGGGERDWQLSAKPRRLAVGALVLRARHARRGADRLLEPGLGDRAAAGAARPRRVARRRPARAHLLLARLLLPAQRRQHRAGRVLHARPFARRTLPGGQRAGTRLPRDHRPQRPALRGRPRLRRVRSHRASPATRTRCTATRRCCARPASTTRATAQRPR